MGGWSQSGGEIVLSMVVYVSFTLSVLVNDKTTLSD